jgi:RHS repeat-associated protein
MTYDAFGVPTSRTGNTSTQNGFAAGWGYQEDPESGLKLVGYRYYDSGSGRFVIRDPGQAGGNWYTYCSNNPAGKVDPYGLQELVGPLEQLLKPIERFGGRSPLMGSEEYFVEGVKFAEEGAKTWRNFLKHIVNYEKYSDLVDAMKENQRFLPRAKRLEMLKKIAKMEKENAGHAKEMDQKWPGWRGIKQRDQIPHVWSPFDA